ncbi:Glycosyl transferase, family 1 [Cynara cardunculus var. scolymus]|uniref:Glycosyl transferase, family 1 n=1 Tax=Cynara cardunculus var. scolymus TaxID=59895 RepID=A0A103Y5H2_CYNCS|nr:Glycosyl transferase, family 1 [Cynara cardunculus var. scolymus]
MAKQSSSTFFFQKKTRWLLLLLAMLSVSTAVAFIIRAAYDSSCDRHLFDVPAVGKRFQSTAKPKAPPPIQVKVASPLSFMKSRLVLLVSHELSLSGGPLLLMELAFLLRGVGAEVCWITIQKPPGKDEVIYSLENKMLDRGVQGQEAIDTAIKADLVVLNTAVAGKWLDAVLNKDVPRVLPKVLWWIHEMRGHYFKLDYVKHLPMVAGSMIDSYVTAEYWKNRTQERLKIQMPETYVVHLGNSKELMDVAEDSVAKRVLREHVRESLGVRNEDILFAAINSVSRGKGQDLFLRSFYESLQLIQEKKLQVPSIRAVIVGSDMSVQTKFETELRNFVAQKKIQHRVHFVNKTLTVAPYLAAIDVLVQNSQGRGECFGRITIEAMAFQLPVLGTSAGGTAEIVVNGSTGFLHPAGKEGVSPLAKNMVKLATHVERRLTMGKRGYERVKERFLEYHMADRIAGVLKEVLHKAKGHH